MTRTRRGPTATARDRDERESKLYRWAQRFIEAEQEFEISLEEFAREAGIPSGMLSRYVRRIRPCLCRTRKPHG